MNCEICILAGGLSQRFGRDKSRLRLGRRTLLGQIRTEAIKTGLRVRVIRRDAIPRCGPLGGVFTALKNSRADAVLFLACDMPFVTAKLLTVVRRRFGNGAKDLFVSVGGRPGFPFFLRRDALAAVKNQIDAGEFSVRSLSRALNAKILRAPVGWRTQLSNINTPEEWKRAVRVWNAQRNV